jgi:N-acetylmuramic acid 6-phosphate etherase
MADRPTEARHPYSEGLHLAPAEEVMSRLLSAQSAAVEAVRPALPALATAAEAAAAVLQAGGRMAYAGAGSSGLMALADCLELMGTFGIPSDRTPMLFAGGAETLLSMTGAVEDDPDLAKADLARAGIAPGDVVICVSASGSTPYTLTVATAAREVGARVIGLANVAGSALLTAADIPVLMETGPEVISGSTRMGAATAQKVALNLLSVLVGIRLGHVHDGYMVNVIADNAKLIDRAARIVASISGTTQQSAAAALLRTGGAVKPAILVAQGAAPEAAIAALKASNGVLGLAMTMTT